jgi:alpha-glucosidase
MIKNIKMKMKMFKVYNVLLFLLVFSFGENLLSQKKEFKLFSPDKRTEVIISITEKIQFSVKYENRVLISPSPIAMQLENECIGHNPVVIKNVLTQINSKVYPVVKIKEAVVADNCNEVKLHFKGDYSVIFRAYNNGVAYRFETRKPGVIIVLSEKGEYNFPDNYTCWWGTEKSFQSNNQVYYNYTSLQQLGDKDLASLPLILNPDKGPKVVVGETDLQDYPGLWLTGANGLTLNGTSARCVKAFDVLSDRRLPITQRHDYIAKTNGTRSFPWRIFAIAKNDGDLLLNQLSYILASENQLTDYNWIEPGKVAWDWWNANNVLGVDFRAGFNTETYKYYIDFASKFGIRYVMLDEGWYVLGDMTKIVPEINMEELVAYGKQKGVDLILWCVWKTLDDQIDVAFEQFKNWGIKGIKVDFMDRDDQWMVNYYRRIAHKAAENKLMVDFHGSFKPAGLHRMYPNVMTYEGVNGGEQYKWSMRQTPEHNLITPFGRMMVGPMDYTPGAMNNAQEKDFKPIFDTPMSMGTRCHQLAMFVAYESPLQMLCDSPTKYYKELDCMKFLSDVPTVWDKTIVLGASVSNYLVVARQNGEKWYMAAMTDWDSREISIDLSFLPDGEKFRMTIYSDGINADRDANDFKYEEIVVDKHYKFLLKMAAGGGMAAMLHPISNL